MAIGHSGCDDCLNRPAYKITPCNHTSCNKHFHITESVNGSCGVCGKIIIFIDNVKQESQNDHIPSLFSTKNTWSATKSDIAMQRGSAHTGNGRENDSGNPRDFAPQTPTRAPRRLNANNSLAGVSQQKYVAPHLRQGQPPSARAAIEAILERPIRPQSSASNAWDISNQTFATQAPMPDFSAGRCNPRPAPPIEYAAPLTNPGGRYRYGQSQLVQQMGNFSLTPHNGNGTGAPVPSFGQGMGIGGNSTFATPQSNRSSANDSAVEGSRAMMLAQQIRRGRADDGRGLETPGPAIRAPKSNLPSVLQRGFVVAAAATDDNSDHPLASVRNANIRGNAAIYIGKEETPMPAWYTSMQDTELPPTVEDAMAALPFVEACRAAHPSTAGVIRVVGIPYTCSRAEIVAFLGRNAQICSQPVGSNFHAVHILMDRLSGKTMDAFIEVENGKEAHWIVTQFAKRAAQGRHAMIGNRPVELQQSNQQELMRELFPLGKRVTFYGGMPVIDDTPQYLYPNVRSTGFMGFLNEEELAHMNKHAEMPNRSPFAQRCLIRIYELIISTLHKYPWYAVDRVLIKERNALYDVVLTCLKALITLLRRTGGHGGHDATKPTNNTLQEYVVAVVTCPGFSEAQKAYVLMFVKESGYGQYTLEKGMNLRFGGTDTYADKWPFRVLAKKPSVSDELVEASFFSGLMRDATSAAQTSIADVVANRSERASIPHFGRLTIDYSEGTTMADYGRIELNYLESMLSMILPRAGPTTASHSLITTNPL
ncbi:hypothetical protein LTR37_010965 [Vermiconidia calcicola]|uniref:Uncharacterized protein n=1 Tax=Vermiconidia calcicola TaxID=1690605 RepID=A0ACC3N3P3_9PEZI|nr:hypothetical protein LTR37_010965 [Vermiconidia calcicola]